MGLDIYLYQYFDKAEADRLEEEYDRRSSEVWAKFGDDVSYKDMTEAQKDECSAETKAIAKEMGLGEWGKLPDSIRQTPEVPVFEDDPDHISDLAYLRSSYNEAGLNAVMENVTGHRGFYYIFAKTDDDAYRFQPDWEASRERAAKLLHLFAERFEEMGGFTVVTEETPNMFEDPAKIAKRCSSKNDALEIYRQEYKRYHDPDNKGMFDSYSGRGGTFFMKEPMEVVAIVQGVNSFGFGGHMPATYLVCRGTEDGYKHYVNSLKITMAMCEWVLSRDNPKQFWLHWSA